MFELEVQASYVGYYSWGGRGLLPYPRPDGKETDTRAGRADEGFMASGLVVSVVDADRVGTAPNLQASATWVFERPR